MRMHLPAYFLIGNVDTPKFRVDVFLAPRATFTVEAVMHLSAKH
jgi:hypothetical protein